jgi:uracil-DNA glycosylase
MGDRRQGSDAGPLVPDHPTLSRLEAAAAGCRACELWADATQTVFGQGAPTAQILLVGEQPGDREDREGKPFVGPAGHLLDRALEEAGIDRGTVYLTNAVKHFRHQARGKRRIHQKPGREHLDACRPWWQAELAVVEPEVLVCLGATAAQALLSPKIRVTTDRGAPIASDLAPHVFVTVHPSSILRVREDDARHAELARFVADLRLAADALDHG